MTLIIIYLIVSKIKDPQKSIFFKSKIDYLVLLFMIITTLPFIFKTYCSYSNTIEFILKYFFIYSVYILARNTITDKKNIDVIITAILICSIIPAILGLLDENLKCLDWILKKLDLVYSDSDAFYSTFGYPNAIAIYMSLCLLLAINKIENSDNKIVKMLTILYIVFITYIIWITKSRFVLALLFLTLVLYFLIKHRKALINNLKRTMLISFAILIIGMPILVCLTKVSAPLIISDEYYYDRLEYDFKPNMSYTLELDVEADVSAVEVKDMAFEIRIIQANEYFFENKIAEERFGKIDGKVTIEFTPKEGCSYIKLRIYNDFHGIIKIRKCYINGEEYILKYKYLPEQLGQIFLQYNLNQKSIKERFFIYKDCFKIAQQSPIIGNGGNTWKIMSPAVEEYKTLLKETHSYFFELLISYGIIGVLAFFIMVIAIFVKLLKQMKNNTEKRREKILIFMGVFLVLIHAITFDFDMSFILIQLMVYICFAMLLYDEQNNEKMPRSVDCVLLIFLVFILSIYIRADIAKYIAEDNKIKQILVPYSKSYGYKFIKERKDADDIEVLKDIQKFINREPFHNQTEVYKLYLEQICNNIDKLSNEELENNLRFVIYKLKTVKFKSPLFLNTIIDRTSIIKSTMEKLKEYDKEIEDSGRKKVLDDAISGFAEALENEYDTHIHNIEDTERNGYSANEANKIKQQYLKILGKN